MSGQQTTENRLHWTQDGCRICVNSRVAILTLTVNQLILPASLAVLQEPSTFW